MRWMCDVVLLLLSVGEFAALLITWPLFIADGEEDRFDQDFQVVDRLAACCSLSNDGRLHLLRMPP